jgi:quinohemoprotein ethanol dehydrogenase
LPGRRCGFRASGTGNDNVFALNAKTGAILWQRWSGINQKIDTTPARKSGRRRSRSGSITSAPLYYDGIVYSRISGDEFGVRGRLTALDAETGRILWRSYALPMPGEFGSDTWPAGSNPASHGGAAIWNTPALDPELGLIYFATGNCGPDYDGSMRAGDNLFCSSIVALNATTGKYAWHFQEVHHDLWDYDAASPVVLFDVTINGQRRKALAEAGRTDWVYLLDRTNGKPLIGSPEKPAPQEPRQKTAKTQPYPVGDAVVPQCATQLPGLEEKAGCIFAAFREDPVLVQPSGIGGTN